MYSRSYGTGEMVPPNYKGNAFECVSADKEPAVISDNHPKKRPLPRSYYIKRREKPEGSCTASKQFALDDIILGGLIVLLLNSHADDELLLILVLLFVVGL